MGTTKINFAVIATAMCIVLCGCTSTDLTEGGKYADRSTFEKGEIKLPANYNKENFRKLLLGVLVKNVKVKQDGKQRASQNAAEGLSARLQTEMAKLKRFSVFSIHNNGRAYFQSLDDVGKAKMQEMDPRKLDITLTLSMILSKEVHERSSDNLMIYEVEIDANCEDCKTGEVKFAEKAKGKVERVEKISLSGRRMGGYNQDDERQAFLQAALQAISTIANKIGNYYPVGGRITGILGDRMTLDRGFEQGVGKDMQMCVYAPVSGVDIPLAVAEAYPSDKSANLKVWRWNTDDEYAKEIIAEMKKDRKWVMNNDIFAVGLRMAVPPEWDREVKEERK